MFVTVGVQTLMPSACTFHLFMMLVNGCVSIFYLMLVVVYLNIKILQQSTATDRLDGIIYSSFCQLSVNAKVESLLISVHSIFAELIIKLKVVAFYGP